MNIYTCGVVAVVPVFNCAYDVDATDGDGDPLNYALSTAPAGTTIDAATGLVAWMPTGADLGIQQFTVLVDDGRGGLAGQFFTILARQPNQAPTVKIGYPIDNQQITVGDTVPIQAQATDADGTITKLEFFVDGLLLGEDAAAPFELGWAPTAEGSATLTATATDNEDDSSASNPLTVQIVPVPPDTEAPEIAISVSPNPAQLGETVTITLSITDASTIATTTLTVNGTDVPLTGTVGAYVTTATGFFTVDATATDDANNTGSNTATFSVTDGSDTTPPTVDLHDDVELQCVELAADLYDIIGSVTDDSNDVRYTLQAKQKGCGAWETLAEGTGNVSNAALTTFDPTSHRNGVYEVRLTAEDAGGNSAEVSGCVLVDGRFKAGQSSIGGIDFNIPQLGYPLLAGRVYDSRNSCEGGFGGGWGMPNEPSNVQAEFTYDPSENWGEDARGNFFTTYYLISRDRKVLVLRIGEGVFKFRMDVNPKSGSEAAFIAPHHG